MVKLSMKWLYLVPVIAIAGFWFYPRYMKGAPEVAESAPPPAPPRALPVLVHRVVPSLLQDQIKVNGQVLADEEAELRAELAGKITEIAFREGTSGSRPRSRWRAIPSSASRTCSPRAQPAARITIAPIAGWSRSRPSCA